MPILSFQQTVPYTEYEMQDHVIKLIMEDLEKQRHELTPVVLSEVTIKSIGRRSDIIIHHSDRKIINIECKLFDVHGVMSQASDHIKWANYSSIYMPYGTYISTGHQKNMIEKGIGLIFYHPVGILIEAINPKYQPKKKDDSLRIDAINSIKKSYSKNS